MANIDAGANDKSGKRNKPKKQLLRVDFTPMVDMNMLLITFFMFCTTLSTPQVMDIVMPANAEVPPVDQPVTPASKTFTVLLGENNKVYYYIGEPNYIDYTSLKETDVQGFRAALLERNSDSFNKMRELRQQRQKKQISEAEFQKLVSEVKKTKDGLTVLIKPTEKSVYKNLVDILDEMQICGIGRYTIMDVGDEDRYMMDNYKSQGELTAERLPG